MTTQRSKPVSGSESIPPPQQSTPGIPLGVQDHSFHAQAVFEINNKIGRLETTAGHVEKRLDRIEVKLDQTQVDMASLKTSQAHIEVILRGGVKALWAIAGGLAVFLLGLFSVWLKHKLGW